MISKHFDLLHQKLTASFPPPDPDKDLCNSSSIPALLSAAQHFTDNKNNNNNNNSIGHDNAHTSNSNSNSLGNGAMMLPPHSDLDRSFSTSIFDMLRYPTMGSLAGGFEFGPSRMNSFAFDSQTNQNSFSNSNSTLRGSSLNTLEEVTKRN